MAKKKPAAVGATIELQRLGEIIQPFKIQGLTPILSHKWSEKAIRQMPGHPDKDKVKAAKEARKPKEEAEAALYKFDGNKVGFPATAFKAAMIGACRFFDKPSMVEAKQLLGVEADGGDQLVEIKCKKVLREDIPRLPNGSADLRYRYALENWSATIRVRFVPQIISVESVAALLDAAGRGGVGDWRPSAPKSMTGTYGTWRVVDEK